MDQSESEVRVGLTKSASLHSKKFFKMQKLPSVGLIVGFTILALSVILGWIVVPKVIDNKISQQVRLLNGSETFDRWRNVQVPIYSKFYLFNVTNANEVLVGGIPKFQQVGPYVYLQKRRKVDISFNDTKDTVSYRQLTTYHFQPELSAGPLNATVTMLNLPLLSFANRLTELGALFRGVAAEYTVDVPTFLNRTVDEMLFGGYYDEMMHEVSGLLGKTLLPNDTFGLQYGKNGTDAGIFEVYTGVKYNDKFGEVSSWNGSPDMPWWEDETCKKIKGTDGSIFPPFVTSDRRLQMFSADLCRSLTLLYEKESEVKGIKTMRFTVDERILEDPIFNRDNMCYCTQPGNRFDNCPKTGAYQLNACKEGKPILVSLPHFLDGSDEYLSKADGLKPEKDEHETFVELEPNTGLLLKAAKRIQINVQLKPIKFVKQLRKLPNLLMPIFWTDESMEVPETSAERLKGKLLRPKSIAQISSWIGTLTGLIIIAVAALIYLIRARKKNYST